MTNVNKTPIIDFKFTLSPFCQIFSKLELERMKQALNSWQDYWLEYYSPVPDTPQNRDLMWYDRRICHRIYTDKERDKYEHY